MRFICCFFLTEHYSVFFWRNFFFTFVKKPLFLFGETYFFYLFVMFLTLPFLFYLFGETIVFLTKLLFFGRNLCLHWQKTLFFLAKTCFYFVKLNLANFIWWNSIGGNGYANPSPGFARFYLIFVQMAGHTNTHLFNYIIDCW